MRSKSEGGWGQTCEISKAVPQAGWRLARLAACLLLAGIALPPAFADTHYVNRANPAPVTPFTNGWASAATNIQHALDVAVSNDVVLVANGVN